MKSFPLKNYEYLVFFSTFTMGNKMDFPNEVMAIVLIKILSVFIFYSCEYFGHWTPI